jgi:putative phage-type endonuclease
MIDHNYEQENFTDYISIFNMLGDCDEMIELCKQRILQSIELHIDEYKNEKINENIINYSHEQVMHDLKPLMNNFISILSNKNPNDITAFDYLQHYNVVNESILECIEHTLHDIYDKRECIQREFNSEYDIVNIRKTNKKIFDKEIKPKLKTQIEYLQKLPQPEQRTEEWYALRHNCITASSAWKVLDTQKQRESFIKSKLIDNSKSQKNFGTSVGSTFHHGHKYEPLSTMLYEKINNTKVGEFGCIRHQKYDFIGASPDGINIDPSSDKYGVLLEIKNVVSREITGIPKKDYWIQMQMQMEVCDLNYCDFLETKFVEYEDEDAFIEDYSKDNTINTGVSNESTTNESTTNTIMKNKNNQFIGLIVMFYVNENPTYEYCPLEINTPEELIKWKDNIIDKYLTKVPNSSWVNNIYWKCEHYSCICVERNKRWFENALLDFKDTWGVIVKRREEIKNNYEEDVYTSKSLIDNTDNKEKRKAKKQTKSSDIFSSGNIGVCLIKLD